MTKLKQGAEAEGRTILILAYILCRSIEQEDWLEEWLEMNVSNACKIVTRFGGLIGSGQGERGERPIDSGSTGIQGCGHPGEKRQGDQSSTPSRIYVSKARGMCGRK